MSLEHGSARMKRCCDRFFVVLQDPGQTASDVPASAVMLQIPTSCKIPQADNNEEWAFALSKVRPITQPQTVSWTQRAAKSIKQSSSSMYRLATLGTLFMQSVTMPTATTV